MVNSYKKYHHNLAQYQTYIKHGDCKTSKISPKLKYSLISQGVTNVQEA